MSLLHIDLLSVDGPRQHILDAVDRLLVVIVAVCCSRKALRAGTNEAGFSINFFNEASTQSRVRLAVATLVTE
jgi:hypothetical protein